MYFYRQDGNINEFKRYFEEKYFKDWIDEFDFLNGKEVQHDEEKEDDQFNYSKFEDLKKKVMIQLDE
jgi:lipopolysaccharide export LptBFGC system permease protein LptF